MRRAPKIILFAAILTLFSGLMAAPNAMADEAAEAYFFNRRNAANADWSLVGPHSSMDATNAAIRWSLDNGYEVEWEADGSAPRILIEETAPVVKAPTQVVVVVPKVIYVKPAYTWHYWTKYRYYWKSWKVKYKYDFRYHWKHKHHFKKHYWKKHKKHNHKKHTFKKLKKYGKSKLKKKAGKWLKKKFKKKGKK